MSTHATQSRMEGCRRVVECICLPTSDKMGKRLCLVFFVGITSRGMWGLRDNIAGFSGLDDYILADVLLGVVNCQMRLRRAGMGSSGEWHISSRKANQNRRSRTIKYGITKIKTFVVNLSRNEKRKRSYEAGQTIV